MFEPVACIQTPAMFKLWPWIFARALPMNRYDYTLPIFDKNRIVKLPGPKLQPIDCIKASLDFFLFLDKLDCFFFLVFWGHNFPFAVLGQFSVICNNNIFHHYAPECLLRCCVFWPANGCFASCLLVEIILSILTYFSITNGKRRKDNK